MKKWFKEVPELNLHLRRLSSNQENDLVKFAITNHWKIKDFHQIAQELEEFINSRLSSEPNYSELLYLQAKFLFFAGDLNKLNDFFTLTASTKNIPGVQLFYALGLAFQGHSDQGLEILKQIDLKFYENDHMTILEIMGAILFIYSIKRDYLSVSDYFYQIYRYVNTINDVSEELKAHILPWAFLRHAYSLRAQGKIFKAMELIEKCLNDLHFFPHRFFQSIAVTLMGHCHHNLGNLKEALDFYDNAIDIAVETQSWLLLTILYNRVGMAMMTRRKIKLAEKYFKLAVNQAKDANAKWLVIGPLANLAQYKLAEGKTTEAIDDYHHFVEIASGVGDEQELCYAQLALAELYRGIGDIPKSKYFLSEGYKLALKLGIFRTVTSSEDELNYN